MEKLRFCVLAFSLLGFYVIAREEYMSAIGDPGMRRDSLRVAIEAWNQCNEVGEEVFGMGSPRMADCFDVDNSTSQGAVYIYIYIFCFTLPDKIHKFLLRTLSLFLFIPR
jgi:hypothetical protein